MKKIITISILLVLTSCFEEPMEWSFDKQTNTLLVIESIITNEKIPQTIKLTLNYTGQNSPPPPATGALVSIKTNETPATTYRATETPAGSGIYKTDSMRAVVGVLYTLFIEYDNKQYIASDTQTFVEPFTEPIPYYQVTDTSYTLAFNESGEQPSFTKYQLDWSKTNECNNATNCQAELYFYDLKNIDINKQIPPDKERVDFPLGTKIWRKKYSMSAQFEAYLRGMLSETEWRGGIFDTYPSNPETNVSEGAIGFFAVCTVLSDSTIVE